MVGNLSFVNAGLDRGHMGRGVPVLVGFVEVGSGLNQFFDIANVTT